VRPTRFPSVLALPVLVVALAACGGSTDSPPGGDGGPQSTPAANPTAPSDDGGGGGGDGGGGAGPASVQALADALAPPSGTEQSRTAEGGLVVVTYTSSESVDSLVAFYDAKLPANGLSIRNHGMSPDGHGANWTFAVGAITGSVTIVEGGSGSGTDVVVSVLDTDQ
jgi:hypothetical protein